MSEPRTSFRFLRSLVAVASLMAVALESAPIAAAQQPADATKPGLDIMLMKPSAPKLGDNTFEVMVKGPDGRAITDADVTVQLYMAAMPAMKMPEMKSAVTLKHQKGGTYVGAGQVTMAGTWAATVVVKRGGKEVGSKKLPITAK